MSTKIKENGHSLTARGGANIGDVDFENLAFINEKGTANIEGKLNTDSTIKNIEGTLNIKGTGEVNIFTKGKRSIEGFYKSNPWWFTIITGVISGIIVALIFWLVQMVYVGYAT